METGQPHAGKGDGRLPWPPWEPESTTGRRPEDAGEGPAGEAAPDPPLVGPAARASRSAYLARRGARAAGHAGKVAGRATARGAWTGAKFVGRGTRAGADRFRGFASADGAAESGLARVSEMQVLASAGDAAFAVSLASTVLALPVGQARGQVAIFLLTTMAPFVLLAPLVGPLLDRYRRGRRWAIGTTLAVRAFLSWVLAGVVTDGSPWVLPLALLCLISTRAYAVALSAGIPLVRPRAITLVTANSRQSIATLVGIVCGSLVAAPVGRFGPQWSLRVAFVLYVVATVLAIRLSARVDSLPSVAAMGEAALGEAAVGEGPVGEAWVAQGPVGEAPVGGTDAVGSGAAGTNPPLRETVRGAWRLTRTHPLPPAVRAALTTASGAKLLAGFVTLFLVFLLQEEPLPGISDLFAMGLVVAAAGVGNAAGSVVGNRLGPRSPTVIASAMLVIAIVASVLTAVSYALWSVIVLGLVSGAFGQLAKLCLDALVQAETPEHLRSRIFSWSETRLQAAWVLGGGLGIVMPLIPWLGFAVATAALVAVLATAVGIRRRAAVAASDGAVGR